MNKYIRTKDGRIVKVNVENGVYTSKYELIGKPKDTIEELCDAFVMFCPNAGSKKIRVYSTMSSISLYYKRDKRWNGNMVDKAYGAIWTDKGLVFVAKLNKDGELELI